MLGSPDVHLDEDEYAELNNKIMQAIIDNYEVTSALIDTDREMSALSSKIEIDNPEKFADKKYILGLANDIIDKNKARAGAKTKDFVEKAQKYLLARSPYDYYYVGKKNIKGSVQSFK